MDPQPSVTTGFRRDWIRARFQPAILSTPGLSEWGDAQQEAGVASANRHGYFCLAIILSLIFAYVAAGITFFETNSFLALYGRFSMILAL